MIDVAETLRACRQFRNMTQKELAQKSGIPYRTISGIECDYHRPNLTTFEILLNAMGFEIEITPRERL